MFAPLNGPKVITRTIRPPRIAYVVSDVSHCDAVIKANSLTWGGKYACMIPYISEGEISDEWWRVLHYYDPDTIILCLTIDKATEERLLNMVVRQYPKAKQDEERKLPVWDLRLDISAIHGLSLLMALYGLGGIEKRDKFFPALIPQFTQGHPLDLYIKSRYGYLDRNLLASIMTNQFRDFGKGLDSFIPVQEVEIADRFIDFLAIDESMVRNKFVPLIDYTLWDLTQQAMGRSFHEMSNDSIVFDEQHLLMVTDGVSVEDCCWYWNLRAQRYLPHTLLPLWLPKDILQEKMTDISKLIHPNRRGYILSKSVPPNELDALAQMLGSNIHAVTSDLDRFYSPSYFLGKKDQVEVNFDENRGRIQKPKADVVQYCCHPQYYYVDIELPDRKLPRLNAGSWGMLLFPNYRVSRSGLTFCERSDGISNYIELTIPHQWQIVETFAGLGGYNIQLSDKGKIGEKIIQLIGGYQNIWVLSGATAYELLDQLSELNQAKEFKDRLRQLTEASRSQVDGNQTINELMRFISSDYHERIQKQYSDFRQILGYSADTSSKLMHWLLKKMLIFRGVVLTCPNCKTKQWVLLDELKSRINCAGCQQIVDTPLDVDSTNWKYRINTLYARAHEQGVIPHLLTAYYFLEKSRAKYIRPDGVTGAFLGLKLDAADGFTTPCPKAEIDVAWIENGELTIGECKTNSRELKEEEIIKYSQLAQSLQCKRVVFSFMDSVSQELEAQIRNIFSITSATVEIVDLGSLCNQFPGRSIIEESDELKKERKENFEINLSAFLNQEESD